MMRWHCWHDWSKWRTYVWNGTVVLPYGDAPSTPMSSTKTKQARVCLKCNLEYHRVVENASGDEYAKVATVNGGAQP